MARKKTNPPQTASKLSPINIAESIPIIFSFYLIFLFINIFFFKFSEYYSSYKSDNRHRPT